MATPSSDGTHRCAFAGGPKEWLHLDQGDVRSFIVGTLCLWRVSACLTSAQWHSGPPDTRATRRDSRARTVSHPAARQSDGRHSHGSRNALLVLSDRVLGREPADGRAG